MYPVLSTQAAFSGHMSHSERLDGVSATCITFWAPRPHFVDRCRILSPQVTFLWHVSHSEHPDGVFSTHVAFWSLGSVSSLCIAFWALSAHVSRFRHLLGTSTPFWFSVIFFGISHNLPSRRSWVSVLHAYARGISTSWWRFKVGSRFCLSFHSFFELAAVLRGVLHVFSRVFLMLATSKWCAISLCTCFLE